MKVTLFKQKKKIMSTAIKVSGNYSFKGENGTLLLFNMITLFIFTFLSQEVRHKSSFVFSYASQFLVCLTNKGIPAICLYNNNKLIN